MYIHPSDARPIPVGGNEDEGGVGERPEQRSTDIEYRHEGKRNRDRQPELKPCLIARVDADQSRANVNGEAFCVFHCPTPFFY